MQRRLLAEQTVKCSLRPAENIVDVDSSFSPKKSGMSHMSGKPKSLACTTDSQPVVSNCTKRKKRKKDLNAGLIIPSALYFSGTTPKGLTGLPTFALRGESPKGVTESPLDKFLY